MSAGILIVSKEGVVSWCNQEVVRVFEEPKTKIVGRSIKDYFDDELKIGNFSLFIGNQTKQVDISDLQILNDGVTAITFQDMTLKKIDPTSNPNDVSFLNNTSKKHYRFQDICGQNIKLRETITMAEKAALTLSPVLIYGETGTGKELFAQSIHYASERCEQPFVAINCAAIPETLLEATLFGTVQGAFTEAVNRPGLFEHACNGTIFLDEINSMPLSLQAKLLRVIQEKTVRRVGDVKDIYVNPRIISSLNVEPYDAVAKGMLRNDLFYRLGVVCLEIPPLRDRKDDILLLIDHFVTQICNKFNRPKKFVSPEAVEILRHHDWPGNVRQFEHAIECAINFAENDDVISIAHFPRYLRFVSIYNQVPDETNSSNNLSLKTEIQNTERDKIINILEKADGRISKAAEMLGISRQSLYYRMKKFYINVQ